MYRIIVSCVLTSLCSVVIAKPMLFYGETPHAKYIDLLVAVRLGNEIKVSEAIRNGAYVNTKGDFSETVLHKAAQDGYDRVADLLIKNGADVDNKDRWGKTPLYYAVIFGHESTADVLINAGADVNAKTIDGDTPLHAVCSERGDNYANIVEWLINNGANVNALNNKNETPLLIATERGITKFVGLLTKNGAHISN